MQKLLKCTNSSEVIVAAVFGLLIFSLFPVMIAYSPGVHWIIPVIILLLMCYPLAEMVFYSFILIQIRPDSITFSRPWRKYSKLRKRPDMGCVIRSDEWDTLLFHRGTKSSSFFFFKDKKAIYCFSANGFSDLGYRIKTNNPDKIIVPHLKFKSIHLMPELFDQYPERIV